MIMKRRFLIVLLLCWSIVPMSGAIAYDINNLVSSIKESTTIDTANTNLDNAYNAIKNEYNTKVSDKAIASADKKIVAAKTNPEVNENSTNNNATVANTDTRTEEEKQAALDEKQDAYKDAKENEQSLANRTLTAASIATTGIGGMELAMGLSEQRADKDAAADMTAYIETFRCTYGNGKQVKAGPDEIELPGGNDETLMKLRSEYMALAADLKERKTALGMKPGIESEEILDKSKMGLYDDENVGIESGAYSSLYRTQMLGSEEDQAKIDEDAKKSKARVIGGGTAAGVGVVGSAVGSGFINGDLGEK